MISQLIRRIFANFILGYTGRNQTHNSTDTVASGTAIANLLLKQGLAFSDNLDNARAIATFDRMTRDYPLDHRGFNNLGASYLRAGHLEKSLSALETARTLSPDSPEATINYALLLRKLDRTAEAIEVLVNFQNDHGTCIDITCTLANFLSECGKSSEAISQLELLVLSHPQNETIHYTIAMLKMSLGHEDEANTSLNKALIINPHHSQSNVARGRLLKNSGDHVAAKEHFDRALRSDPRNPDAQFNRALIFLSCQNFKEGWEGYDFRLFTAERPAFFPEIPIWQITDPTPKHVLVTPEQGLGDELMFASCIPDLMREVEKVVIGCDERLAQLYKRSFRSAEILPMNRTLKSSCKLKCLEKIDCQVAIGSLPRRYRKSSTEFPMHRGYLEVDESLWRNWKDKLLALGDNPKIGIAWRGGLDKTNREFRTIPAQLWGAVLKQPSLTFIALQHDAKSVEISQFNNLYNIFLHHFPSTLCNLDETAALIKACDLIISIPTTFAHLGGALGVNTWILTPARSDWRYEYHGNSMLWYPSVHLFRQAPGTSWEAIMQKIAISLKSRYATAI